jgi:hypothetical protein
LPFGIGAVNADAPQPGLIDEATRAARMIGVGVGKDDAVYILPVFTELRNLMDVRSQATSGLDMGPH